MDRPRRSDCTAGQMDGEAGWWTTSGNIGLPPLARVMGVGRQQQLIADVISNSDHITLNTNTPTRVPNTTLQQTSSPRYLTHFTTGHRGQLNTHYHQTTYPYLPQLTYDMTTDYNKTDGPLPTTRKQTGHNLQKTQSPLSLRPPYPPTYTLPT